jgi:NAD(P)-dependent dehydrogenase (short-subunit alcohol dehydrogenase family)
MKYALVTGANKGIGYHIVKGLVAKGFTVFLAARNKDAGEKAAKELKAQFVQLDVADEQTIAKAVKDVSKITKKLDVLVNNAGIMLDPAKSVLDMTDSDFNKTMDTNVLGVLRVTRAFRPLIESARIINVSSRLGQLSGDMGMIAPAYCISKTALNMLTVGLSEALPNALVNTMCPGWVKTDLGGPNAPGTAEQGADTAIWLATEAPANLTGSFVAERKVIEW